jgi:hypothetical protein
MINFIESSAGRIAARIQEIGTGFDPDVLALPGGSVLALFFWVYASAVLNFKRPAAASSTACAGCGSGP